MGQLVTVGAHEVTVRVMVRETVLVVINTEVEVEVLETETESEVAVAVDEVRSVLLAELVLRAVMVELP